MQKLCDIYITLSERSQTQRDERYMIPLIRGTLNCQTYGDREVQGHCPGLGEGSGVRRGLSRPGSDCSLLGPPRSGRPPGCLGVAELASQASFGDMQGWRVLNTHLGERRGTAVDPPWSA